MISKREWLSALVWAIEHDQRAYDALVRHDHVTVRRRVLLRLLSATYAYERTKKPTPAMPETAVTDFVC